MTITGLIVLLIVAGVVLAFFPGIDPMIRRLILTVLAVLTIVVILRIFGLI